MKNIIFSSLFILVQFFAFGQIKINHSRIVKTNVKEPSGICLSSNHKSFFIVSDNGFLNEVDFSGKIIRTASFEGVDFEAVCIKDSMIYVSDETPRRIHVFHENDLHLVKSISLNYNGGRNKGFESVVYLPEKDNFLLITEKDPVYFREYSKSFQLMNEIEYPSIKEISDAIYYKSHLYVLSDEESILYKLNLEYQILKSYQLSIINPEGIAISKDGLLYVVSDDLERIYVYENWE